MVLKLHLPRSEPSAIVESLLPDLRSRPACRIETLMTQAFDNSHVVLQGQIQGMYDPQVVLISD